MQLRQLLRVIPRMAMILSLGLLVQACAAPSASLARGDARVLEMLARQADQWDKAIVRKDRAAIADNMTGDFRQIDGDDDLETKASFIEGLMSPALTIDPYTVEDFDVRIYDNVALLSGRTRMTGRYESKPFTSHYRYIDIYVRSHGGWQIASVQITRIKN